MRAGVRELSSESIPRRAGSKPEFVVEIDMEAYRKERREEARQMAQNLKSVTIINSANFGRVGVSGGRQVSMDCRSRGQDEMGHERVTMKDFSFRDRMSRHGGTWKIGIEAVGRGNCGASDHTSSGLLTLAWNNDSRFPNFEAGTEVLVCVNVGESTAFHQAAERTQIQSLEWAISKLKVGLAGKIPPKTLTPNPKAEIGMQTLEDLEAALTAELERRKKDAKKSLKEAERSLKEAKRKR